MRFSYNGKQIRRPTVTEKKLAEKIYCKVMTKIAEGKWFEVNQHEDNTFEEMMDKYLLEYSPKKAPKTYMRDKSLVAHLNRYFGHYKLNKIAPKDIYAYKIERIKECAAPKTVNNELILMGHAFNLAIKEWEWVNDNPVSKVSKEKVSNQIERWLTFEEEKRLLETSPYWLQEIILFCLNTGLRRGELIDLVWDRVDLERKTFTILEQKNKCKDTLPLNEKAIEILMARNKIRSIKNDFVFYNNNGNKIGPDNLDRSFRLAVKKAGIEKFRFHDLRHTFATRLIQNGVDVYAVQRLGRWKSISMVMRYAHHYAESLRSGVEILDKVQNNFSTNLAQSHKKGITAIAVIP